MKANLKKFWYFDIHHDWKIISYSYWIAKLRALESIARISLIWKSEKNHRQAKTSQTKKWCLYYNLHPLQWQNSLWQSLSEGCQAETVCREAQMPSLDIEDTSRRFKRYRTKYGTKFNHLYSVFLLTALNVLYLPRLYFDILWFEQPLQITEGDHSNVGFYTVRTLPIIKMIY